MSSPFRPLLPRRIPFFLFLSFIATSQTARAQGWVDRLLAPYEAITTVVCQVRKETTSPAGTMRTLSRVYYAKGDRLHVENISPIKRRILCDGQTFYSYIEGDPKGFSRPVKLLDQEMLIQLRKIPGTGMDHLFRVRGLDEQPMAATAEFPMRASFNDGRQWIVLSQDAGGRLALIEFFNDASNSHKVAEYRYKQFNQVLPGVWIPLLHEAWLESGGVTTRETTRIDNIEVNGPIAEDLFKPGLFFKGVEFVDSFQKIYR